MARRRSRVRRPALSASKESSFHLGWTGELIGLPGAVACLLAWGLLDEWSFGLEDPLLATQILVLSLGLLAILLRQGRTLLAALLLAGFLLSPSLPPNAQEVGIAFLPILLGLLTLLAPRHPFRRRNVLTAAALATIAWFLFAAETGAARDRIIEATSGYPVSLPNIGFGLAAVGLLIRLLYRPSPLTRGALWSLPFLYGLGQLVNEFGWNSTPGFPAPIDFAGGVTIWLVAALGEAHSLSFRDALTRLPGRRALNRELAELGRRYVIAMVDIDHFKRVNDRHGHETGDQVLAMVAARLQRVRSGKAFRFGGEEFAIVFPRKNLVDCEARLEEVRRRIDAKPFGLRGSKKRLKVTVSLGAADRTNQRSTPEEVLAAADKALYRAKKAGRNRVKLASST